MKKFIVLPSILIGLLAWQTNAEAESGIYFNILSGWANVSSFPSQSSMGATHLDRQQAPIVRGGIGYLHDFNFNPHYGFGFEIGAGWFGRSTYTYANGTQDSAQTSTTEFLAVLTRHIKKLDVFVKAGGIRNTTHLELTSGNIDSTDIQMQLGGGINYHIAPHVAVTTAYYHTFSNNGLIVTSTRGPAWRTPSLNEVLVGMRFNFT